MGTPSIPARLSKRRSARPVRRATVAAMTTPPRMPMATTRPGDQPSCHSGMATAANTPRPTAQAPAVATTQLALAGRQRRNSSH